MFLSVNQSSSEDTVLYVYKRRMGLTKRGGYQNETLSVSSVIVEQTDTFTWSETSDFVQFIIPTSHIQQKKVRRLSFYNRPPKKPLLFFSNDSLNLSKMTVEVFKMLQFILFQINAVLLIFLFIRENSFNIDNKNKYFLSTKSDNCKKFRRIMWLKTV